MCFKFRYRRDGVASTVGTLLAVIVMVLFLSILMSQWVPVWIEDIEAEHMAQVSTQFSTLKSTIDNLILQNNRNLTMSSPITLGTKGVPMLSGGSTGSLTMNIQSGDVSFTTEDNSINSTGSGTITYNAMNKFFSSQKYIYENGGIVLIQSSGTVVSVPPQFSVSNESGNISLSYTVIYIVGENITKSGSDTKIVYIRLIYHNSYAMTWSDGKNISLNISTDSPSAWATYYNSTLGNINSGSYNVTTGTKKVYVNMSNVREVRIGRAVLEISIS